ncbi:MAG: hypothetical protein BWY51_00480 [Parcubacteria group bacterium ADurb.Bin316]|nr:MAG: hypothetical protein BWY51_00480 [Parcubacteria group bacterium ADurb.Bin316]HOZ55910.1 hypothetical protein [bacterium]
MKSHIQTLITNSEAILADKTLSFFYQLYKDTILKAASSKCHLLPNEYVVGSGCMCPELKVMLSDKCESYGFRDCTVTTILGKMESDLYRRYREAKDIPQYPVPELGKIYIGKMALLMSEFYRTATAFEIQRLQPLKTR